MVSVLLWLPRQVREVVSLPVLLSANRTHSPFLEASDTTGVAGHPMAAAPRRILLAILLSTPNQVELPSRFAFVAPLLQRAPAKDLLRRGGHAVEGENEAKTNKHLSLSGHWGWSPCKSAWMERRNQCVGWNQSALMGARMRFQGMNVLDGGGKGIPN